MVQCIESDSLFKNRQEIHREAMMTILTVLIGIITSFFKNALKFLIDKKTGFT